MDLDRLNRDLLDVLQPQPSDPIYGTVVDVDALSLQALVLVRSAKNARWLAIQGADLATQLDVRAEAGERVRVLIQHDLVVGMAAGANARRANLTQNSVNPAGNSPIAQSSFALIGIGGPAPTTVNKAEVYGNMKVRGQINIAPGSAMPPLVLGANAQGQTVVGLRADQLNRTLTGGDGINAIGTLTADRTVSVDSTVLRTTGHGVLIASTTVLGHVKVGSSLSINAGTGVLDVVAGTTAPGPHASTHSSGGTDPITISNLAGTITDAQHGSKTTGTLHAVATGSVAGFMSSADFTKLAGVATGATANTGTVTSVAMTVPSILSVTGSPVTTSGTLAVSLANQTANTVLAGPTTGAATTPTFRALVAADILPINLASTANGGITGTLPAANGGTGQGGGYAIGDILYASGASVLSKLADVATGNALISGGVTTAPSWGKIGLTTHVSGTLPVGNGGTGLTGYTTGDLLYASGASTLAALADAATGNALISGGAGVAPSYGKIGLTTHISGTLPIANGGTNAITAAAALVSLNAAVAGQVFGAGTGITGGGTHGTTTSTISYAVDQAFSPTWTGTHTFNLQPTIAANLSFSGARSITSTSTNNLTLAPGGDLLLDPVGNDVLPVTGYDLNLGALNQKFLTLHAAELWVETLVAQNTMATIGGRILVGPTTTLTSDLTAVATTITVKHNQMANGDRVYLEANGNIEFLAIASAPSGTGPYTYTVTRNLDGSGANAWSAGDAIFNTGTTGTGFIDLYSVRGVKASTQIGPTIQMNVRNSATFNDWSEHAAIGNLNGLYDYGTNVYGAAFGKQTAHWLGIDATNGIRFMVNTTQYANWSAAGNIQVGQTGTGSSVQINTGGDVLLNTVGVTKVKLDNAGTVTVGEVASAKHNVQITGSTINFRDNLTTIMQLGYSTTPYVLIGPNTTANIYAYNGDVFLRQATTAYVSLTNTGVVTIGPSGSAQMVLTGNNMLLKNATGVTNFAVNASGNMNLNGVMDIGSSGGIYQGSGSFATPTTGLKIWNDTGVGRIAGYTSTVEQWSAGTDGKFKAGSGDVVLSDQGVTIKGGSGPTNAITWIDPAHSNNTLVSISGRADTVSHRTAAYFLVTGTDNTAVQNAQLIISATSSDGLTTSFINMDNTSLSLNTNNFSVRDTGSIARMSWDATSKWVVGDPLTVNAATTVDVQALGSVVGQNIYGTVAANNFVALRVANTATDGMAYISWAETVGGTAQFYIRRYGSFHLTTPNLVELFNVNAGDMRFVTNNTERLRLLSAGGGNLVGTWNTGSLVVTGSIAASSTVSGSNLSSSFVATTAGSPLMTTAAISTTNGVSGGGSIVSGLTLSFDLNYSPTWAGTHTFNNPIKFPNFTTKSVLFVNTGSNNPIGEDNANFAYDYVNHWLGLGTSSPATRLDVRGQISINPSSAGPPFVIGANGTNQAVSGLVSGGVNRSAIAGNGLTGGGSMAIADATLTLGTPSTLTVATGNAVTTTSHTHLITTASTPGAAAVILATTATGALNLHGQLAHASTTPQTQETTNHFASVSTRVYETGISFYANRAVTQVDFAYQLVTPSTWTDVTTELAEAAGTVVTLFPTGATTTQMYMGAATKFTELYFLATTLGIGGTYVWEYSSGPTFATDWTTLTVGGVNDFTASGYATWTDPGAGWVNTMTVNGQTGRYWIRVRATAAPTQAPTAQAWNISVANGDYFRGVVGGLIKTRINVNGNINTAGTISPGDGLAGTAYNTYSGVLSGTSSPAGTIKSSAAFQVGTVLGVGTVPVATNTVLVQAAAISHIPLQVNGFSASTTANLANFWTSANQGWSFDKLGRAIHIQTTAPTIAAGAGAGGTPTLVQVVAGSTDVVGQINITTGGTAPTANATVATITFNTGWGTAPKYVQLEPANAVTAALGANWAFVSTISTTTFVITSNAVALANTTAYSWRYHVIG